MPAPTCNDQTQISPTTARIYGTCIPTKKRAVTVPQTALTTLVMTLLDQNGNPINLGNCNFPGTGVARFAFKEATSFSQSDISYIDGTVTDPANGVVEVTLSSIQTSLPAVLDAQIGIFADNPDSPTNSPLLFTNSFYVWVERGLFFKGTGGLAGLMSLDDCKLFLRDNGPQENLLIKDFEYDLAEFCYAAQSAIRYWNEAQPPIYLFFKTSNFNYLEYWKKYVCGYVMQMASRRFLRNHLPYQAGGVAIDDLNKFKEYAEIGQKLQDEYTDWVKRKKVQLNCESAITSGGSPYGAEFNGWWGTGYGGFGSPGF
jgi:hypothetical protein